MSQSLLAIVEISFADGEDLKKGTAVIESNLRENRYAVNFAVYQDKITFNLQFDGQADYSILEKIKTELIANGQADFNIRAREFTETKQLKF